MFAGAGFQMDVAIPYFIGSFAYKKNISHKFALLPFTPDLVHRNWEEQCVIKQAAN